MIVDKVLSGLHTFIRYFVNSVCYVRIKKKLIIKAWVNVENGKLIPNNWGDDLNMYLLPMISKRNVIVANRSLFHILFKKRNYLCIGSILGDYEDRSSEIWGAGFISEEDTLKAIPCHIHSVRGKYTRNKIIEAGLDCPECYGDPALLAPLYYKPNKPLKRYKMGIIPNHIDSSNLFIKDFLSSRKDCLLINMVEYNNWTDVIDKICSCDYIISSSLHGLIISDAYKIPNSWVYFSNNIIGGKFKYLDYFSSVDRKETEPIIINSDSDIERLLFNPVKYNTCKVNYKAIIDSCPFKYI